MTPCHGHDAMQQKTARSFVTDMTYDKDHVEVLHTVAVVADRLCGLVVRVLGYRSGGPRSIPGTTRKKK
jgi:hypothetical protein